MKNRYHLFSCPAEKFARFSIRRISVFCFILSLWFPAITRAQNVIETPVQAQFKKEAAGYFEQDDLVAAYPFYSQLLSNYPHDPTYNYRFGACMLYANGDKRRAERYILYGMKQGAVENLAYYYLGRAQHLNYEFDKAIRTYEKFEQIASPGELKKYPVTHLIEMCQNGKQLLVNSDELDVLRKKELKFSIFFEAYSMHANGGSLILEPDEFKTKVDKKNKVVNLMYVTPDKTEAFFSSYGNSEDNGKDIYVIKRKPDGGWGAAVSLGSVINTAFDEDYPVYDAPRNTLYFSSKGHNSMGGYDIFGSVYNDTTQTWSQPYNLDFPINTPDDDILLVPDTSGKVAFFASARSSPEGKVNVYKVALHLHPPGTIVVAGSVSKAGSKDGTFSIITVKDSTNSQVVAVDTTSSQDGSYSFNLPGSGKYVFTVEDSTHKGQSQAVYLANAEARIALEENIQFDSSGALRIKNYRHEKYNDSASRLAYIQKEAQMDVNVDTNSIQSVIAQSGPTKPAINNATASAASSSTVPSNNVGSSGSNVNPTVAVNNNAANSQPSSAVASNNAGSSGSNNNPTVAVNNNAANSQPSPAIASNNTGNSGLNNNPTGVVNNNAANSQPSPAVASNNTSSSGSNNNPTGVVNNSAANSQPSPPADNTGNSGSNNNPTRSVNNSAANSQPSPAVATDNAGNSGTNNNPTGSVNNSAANSQPSPVVASNNMGSSGSNNNPTGSVNNSAANSQPSPAVATDNMGSSGSNNNPTGSVNNSAANSQPSPAVATDNMGSSGSNNNPTGVVNNNTTNSQLSPAVAIDNTGNSGSNNNPTGVVKSNDTNSGIATESQKTFRLEEDKQQLNDKATNAIEYANNEMEQALQLQQRAKDISNNPNGGANSDSVAILSQESKVAAEKGMEGYRVAAEYKSDVASKQEEINKVDNTNSSNGSDNAGNETSTAKATPGDIIRQQAEEVKDDSLQTAAANDETRQEISGLQQKSEDFIGQADQTKDPRQKVALLQQANDLSKSKEEKQAEVRENNVRLQQLHNQYTWLNNKAKKADSISIASANTGNSTNTINPAVQKEIDAYAATSGSDSSDVGAPGNNIENGITANQNPVVAQNTNSNTPPGNTGINRNTQTTSVANTGDGVEKNSNAGSNTGSHPEAAISASTPAQKNADNFSPGQTDRQEASVTIEYTDTVTARLDEKSQSYYAEASVLNDTVQKIRNEAKAEQNKSKSEVLYNRADSIDAVTFQLNSKADEMATRANTRQYSANTEQIENIKAQLHNLQSDRIDKAKSMLKDADDNYSKSISERDSANNANVPERKQKYMESAKRDLATAIVKQQKVVYLYFQADSAEAVGPVSTSNADSNTRLTYSDFLKKYNSGGGSSQNVTSENTVLSPKESTNEVNTRHEPPIDSSVRVTATSSVRPDPQPANVNSNASVAAASLNDGGTKPVGDTGKVVLVQDTTNIFIDSHKSNYSASKPIPIDPPKPTGVTFGVQVGAFRNAIPPDLFKGFEPIVGLKTPEGYIRYVAGVFKTFKPAKEAAGKIRELGYQGAFVVAFYNGKRIPVKEALEKLGISSLPEASSENLQTNAVQGSATTPGPVNRPDSLRGEVLILTENTIVPSKKALIDTKRRDERSIKDTVPPPANSISDIKGLVYTVQVGSFTTRKGFSRLRKIKDLYYWTDASGVIKYNSGTYSGLADARAARDIIIANSAVKDAFVTTYYNGKRITPTEANNLLNMGVTNTVAPVEVQQSQTNVTAKPPVENNSTNKVIDSSSFALASLTKVIYTVRIASFTGQLPVDTVNKLLAYATERIEPYKEPQGITTYYAGTFTDYESAEVLQQKFFNGGFRRAVVEAFYHGKKIPVHEAQLIKNN